MHESYAAAIHAYPEALFAYLDEHTLLSSHMSRPSWRMGGGSMSIESDAARGKAVGSRLRLAGRAFGVRLAVETEVVERQPPQRKVWATVAEPRLLVVGAYRMGFETTPLATGSLLRVFIDYEYPAGATRILGRLCGAMYARWCTRQMVSDAQAHFAPRAQSTAPATGPTAPAAGRRHPTAG